MRNDFKNERTPTKITKIRNLKHETKTNKRLRRYKIEKKTPGVCINVNIGAKKQCFAKLDYFVQWKRQWTSLASFTYTYFIFIPNARFI